MKTTITFIILCIICFLIPINFNNVGFGNNQPIYTHFTYIFFHTSPLHLSSNLISIFFLSKSIKISSKYFLATTLLASTSSFLCNLDKITVGSSGIVMILAGIQTVRFVENNSKHTIPFLSVCLINITIGFFFNTVNPIIHITSYTAGFLLHTSYKLISDKSRHHREKQDQE